MAAGPKQKKNNQLKACAATVDQRIHLKPLTGHTESQALFGGVSLNRTLPPVAKNLQKGAVFEATNLPKKRETSGEWYKIPLWMAGKWHREKSSRFVPFFWFTREDTYTDQMDHIWGEQMDRFGIIWHRRNEPFTEVSTMDNLDCSKTITLQKPVLVSDSKVIILYKDITVEYSKINHIVIKTYQHEQLSEFSKDGDILYEEVWDRLFDQDGNLTGSGHGRSYNTKVSAFEPMDFDKKTGVDLKKDFAIYLSNHKFSNRIPNHR
jgi:hypothetical protein